MWRKKPISKVKLNESNKTRNPVINMERLQTKEKQPKLRKNPTKEFSLGERSLQSYKDLPPSPITITLSQSIN